MQAEACICMRLLQPPPPPEDPYAFFPKPDQNNQVQTTINFSDGSIMHVANTPEQLATHLKVRLHAGCKPLGVCFGRLHAIGDSN
eukprot:scaffold216938_cov18-Tisochrysis_lutea.AAC.1